MTDPVSRYRSCARWKIHSRLAKRRKRMGSLSTNMRPLISSSTTFRISACYLERGPDPNLTTGQCGYHLFCPNRRVLVCCNRRRQIRFLRPPMGALQPRSLLLRLANNSRLVPHVLTRQRCWILGHSHPQSLLLFVDQAIYLWLGPGQYDHQGR